jgi:hypothetical protein
VNSSPQLLQAFGCALQERIISLLPKAWPSDRSLRVRSSPSALLPFFTIGHSTRSIDEFVDLLSNAEVRLVMMFGASRAHAPTSNTTRGATLAEALSKSRIGYAHIAALAACADASGTCRRRS